MAKFSQKFPVPGKPAAAIYAAISTSIETFISKTPLGTADIQRDEAAKSVSFKAGMASGVLTASDNELQVDISLSLLASPFKGKIEEGVTKWLNKTFGA
jgi:hypothetical protein